MAGGGEAFSRLERDQLTLWWFNRVEDVVLDALQPTANQRKDDLPHVDTQQSRRTASNTHNNLCDYFLTGSVGPVRPSTATFGCSESDTSLLVFELEGRCMPDCSVLLGDVNTGKRIDPPWYMRSRVRTACVGCILSSWVKEHLVRTVGYCRWSTAAD